VQTTYAVTVIGAGVLFITPDAVHAFAALGQDCTSWILPLLVSVVVTVPPPPSRIFPVGQVAVELTIVSCTDVVAKLPVMIWLPLTEPVAPVAPVAPTAPVPVAPVAPTAPVPVAPVPPTAPVSP
jgi:hypothetical protein